MFYMDKKIVLHNTVQRINITNVIQTDLKKNYLK